MRVVGVEPTRLAAQEPKSCASTNSTIPAYSSILQLRPNRLNIVSVPAAKVNHCIDISALHSAYYRRTIVSFSMAERGFLPMRRSKLRRAGSIAATYLLVAALAVLLGAGGRWSVFGFSRRIFPFIYSLRAAFWRLSNFFEKFCVLGESFFDFLYLYK